MRRKIAIYLPLFALLSSWYVELLAVFLSILISWNITKIFNGLEKKHFAYFFLFICAQLILLFIIGYDTKKCIEQIGLISVTGLAYRAYFMYVIKNDISLFTKCYINMSIILVIYSLIAYSLNITTSGRLEGWGGEPGDISLLILPVIVYYLYNKELSVRSFLTFIAFLLANSTASYTALAIIISIYLIVYYRKHFIKLAVSLIVIVSAINNFSNYLDNESQNSENEAIIKFKETWDIIKTDEIKFQDLESLNASTYAFLANLKVSMSAPSRFFGTGLGTHQINYEKVYPYNGYRLYGLNSTDAYSLSIRVFSEFGILGLFLLFIFLYKNFNSKLLFSFMALSYIINACITGGHYTANGSMLFFMFFYFAGKYKFKGQISK